MASVAKEFALKKALANLGAAKKPVASTKVDITSDEDMSFSELPIDQIEPYHYNPRTSRNPRYDELLESIKADGITNILTVTRPPKGSKYTTYGGGNTRLMIAKELHAAGDTRFAKLQVIVKAWPGEAQIISAQLSENENRADITFWEKAGGVDRFRQEFEKESKKSLSTNALHAELKKRGVNYGVRTLQNFMFALENLQPIGPWLRATDVNESLRPVFSNLQRLAQKLGRSAAVQDAMTEVQKAHASKVQVAQQPQLDTTALIADWHEACAKQLEVSAEHLQVMLDALKEDTNISAQALRDACATKMPAQAAPAPQEVDAVQDADLGVDEALEETPADTTDEGATASLKQEHPTSQNKAGKNSGADIPGKAAMDTSKLWSEVRAILKRICDVAPLQDVIRESDDMLFGFFIDFPDNPLDGQFGVNPRLRAAMWKMLVAVSGQLDRRLISALPTDDSSTSYRFSRELVQDADMFQAAFEKHGISLDAKNHPLMRFGDLAAIFADPQLPNLLIQLFDAIDRIRAIPGNALDGFQELHWRQ